MYWIAALLAISIAAAASLFMISERRRMARHEEYLRDLYQRSGAKRV